MGSHDTMGPGGPWYRYTRRERVGTRIAAVCVITAAAYAVLALVVGVGSSHDDEPGWDYTSTPNTAPVVAHDDDTRRREPVAHDEPAPDMGAYVSVPAPTTTTPTTSPVAHDEPAPVPPVAAPAPTAPTTTPTTTAPVVHEDEPGWVCDEMGNGVCGPVWVSVGSCTVHAANGVFAGTRCEPGSNGTYSWVTVYGPHPVTGAPGTGLAVCTYGATNGAPCRP